MLKIKNSLLFLGDICNLYISLALTLFIRYGAHDFIKSFIVHIIPFSIIFCFWIILFYLSDFYKTTALKNIFHLFWRIARTITLSFIFAIIAFYLFPNFFNLTPKTNLVIFCIIFSFLAYGFRILFLKITSQKPSRLFVLGGSQLRDEVETYIAKHPHLGYEIVEWIERPTVELLQKIYPLLIPKESNKLVLGPDIMNNPEIATKIYELLSENIEIIELLNLYEDLFSKVPLELLSIDWFVTHITTHHSFYEKMKRVIDIICGFIAIIIFFPLAILIGLLIKITSSGPIFYVGERTGYQGKVFKFYKFRTMHNHAHGPLWTEKDDPRITSMGKLLRKTHLDEIPQLLNVLKGDISFTGPRPERIELTKQYKSFKYYNMRHMVKPGITGWAQINYRPSASPEEAYEKLKFDIFYIHNRSFFLDSLIMIRTLKYFFFSQIHD